MEYDWDIITRISVTTTDALVPFFESLVSKFIPIYVA